MLQTSSIFHDLKVNPKLVNLVLANHNGMSTAKVDVILLRARLQTEYWYLA